MGCWLMAEKDTTSGVPLPNIKTSGETASGASPHAITMSLTSIVSSQTPAGAAKLTLEV